MPVLLESTVRVRLTLTVVYSMFIRGDRSTSCLITLPSTRCTSSILVQLVLQIPVLLLCLLATLQIARELSSTYLPVAVSYYVRLQRSSQTYLPVGTSKTIV
jgi:hypothetical protein